MYKLKIKKEFHEVVELDGRMEIHLKHIEEMREKIKYFERQQNEANNTMCSLGRTQSDVDGARAIYRNASKQKSLAQNELQHLNNHYSELVKLRGETYRNLNNCELQKQYEAENIPDLTEQNKQISKTIIELRKKTKMPLLRLESLKKTLIDLDNQLAILLDAKDELKEAHDELEEGKLEARISKNERGLDSLRIRYEDAKRSLAEAQKYLSGEDEYQKLRERIFERAKKFKNILAGVNSEIKHKEINVYINSSLIEQIRYQVILKDLLQCLKTMVAYDDMTEGQSLKGRDLIKILTTVGLTKPTADGSCEPHQVFKGFLDNLDVEKFRLESAFEETLIL
jgi:hypothetical protein